MVTAALDTIEKKLSELKKKNRKQINYCIPKLWIDDFTDGVENVKPFDFFLDKISEIRHLAKKIEENAFKKVNTENSIIYNLFARYATAFDHDRDGNLALPIGADGFRETGTFLKAIALLPYIKSLDANIIYLLPVMAVGRDRKKGNLGSPYAIRNPYLIDDMLAEPILELGEDLECKAFVEACHLLGMKVIFEFVFRTASVDSDFALTNPEWFYWIKEKTPERQPDSKNEKHYGPPIFKKQELTEIKEKIEAGEFEKLIPPHEEYQNLFMATPQKVARVEDRVRGILDGKTELKIPGAFADWPPDDSQPLWSDVTYLKLFNHKDFNYIAYNTVRMYDKALAKESNKVEMLWENITGIIPHYRDNFGIDGVMIDMGHALPPKLRKMIVNKARNGSPDFIFWEENFIPSVQCKEEGYNAVVGYLMFDQHDPEKMKSLVSRFQNSDIPINFFLTPENHNTPRAASRAGGKKFALQSWFINQFFPMPLFIHNGFELGESKPVNTGLEFTEEEIEQFPAEDLALFSAAAIDWENGTEHLSEFKEIMDIAERIKSGIKNPHIVLIEAVPPGILAFLLRDEETMTEILIAANIQDVEAEASVSINAGAESIIDYGTADEIRVYDGKLHLKLDPFGRFAGKVKLGNLK